MRIKSKTAEYTMRTFEFLLLLSEALALLVVLTRRLRSKPFVKYALVLPPILAIVQAIAEAPRPAIVPAYAVAAVFLFLFRWPNRARAGAEVDSKSRRIITIFGSVIGGSVLIIAIALPNVFPVFSFPKPTGRYAIGTVIYDWTDRSRLDTIRPAPGLYRELMVQVWYPAPKGWTRKRDPYVHGINFALLCGALHLPSWCLDHLRYVMTSAQPSAPVVSGGERFPVLIFAPGNAGFRSNSYFQIQDLVSHGYIVAGMDEPYTDVDAAFPDGRHIAWDERMIHEHNNPKLPGYVFLTKIIFPILGEDAVFVLNQLQKINQDDPDGILTGRLDLSELGILGASLGGSTAAEACRMDDRFKACLGLDVGMPPDAVETGLKQPIMWFTRSAKSMQREGWKPYEISEDQSSVKSVFDRLPGDGYLVYLYGIHHPDISDLPTFFARPLDRFLGLTGSTDWRKTHAIINAYSLAFFDEYLKGEPEPLLGKRFSREFPGVTLVSRR